MKTQKCECECELCCDDDKKLIKLYFCPKCRSHNVRFVFEFGNVFGLIPRMKCFNCNFVAPVFPTVVTTKRKIMEAGKKIKKKNKKKARKR